MAVVQAELGEYGIVLGGERVETGETVEIRSPYDGALVALVHRAGPAEVERAIAGAVGAFETTRKLPAWRRSEVLQAVSDAITRPGRGARPNDRARGRQADQDGAGRGRARVIHLPRRRRGVEADLRRDRAARLAARERGARRPRSPRAARPIAGISPFNFPLNLVAHKVAPALAAGNPIVLRPASQTPVSSLKLAEIVLEAGWPADGIAVVPCSADAARPLVEDDRIKLLTFTGSPVVGWGLKMRAGRKRVTLELGGNAAVIVNDDADVAYAAERVAWGGFAYAGQTCISVQRVYVHERVYDVFAAELVRRVEALSVGDPLDEETDVGPVIDAAAADRVEEWLDEAVSAGAAVLTGGSTGGQSLAADRSRACAERRCARAVRSCSPRSSRLTAFDDVSEAISAAGRSEFGLQAGMFTNDLRVIDEAFDRIDVGGLMVNDVSTFRIDHMPYGGVKSSGSGREGIRYAIEEMTELKLLTFNPR